MGYHVLGELQIKLWDRTFVFLCCKMFLTVPNKKHNNFEKTMQSNKNLQSKIENNGACLSKNSFV